MFTYRYVSTGTYGIEQLYKEAVYQVKRINVIRQLWIYDLIIFLAVEFTTYIQFKEYIDLNAFEVAVNVLISLVCVFVSRSVGCIYNQMWRYGGIQCYIRLFAMDAIATAVNCVIMAIVPFASFPLAQILLVFCMDLLIALSIRMLYSYAYKYGNKNTGMGRVLNFLLRVFAGARIERQKASLDSKVKIAIIGAGRIGVALAEHIATNPASQYVVRCFVDRNPEKTHRTVNGIRIFLDDASVFGHLREMQVEEVVLAVSEIDDDTKRNVYNRFEKKGFKVRLYDYPIMQSANDQRQLRPFDIEELLFRKTADINIEKVYAYYKDKVVLITGGGGSIGSELCRQLAKMSTKQIIILDVYENGAYDVQQELRLAYGKELDLRIEIASITNRDAIARVFDTYRPDIVINAAVENNVFGTKNLVDLCEEYGVERFLMVSTDKAVNPTNVMGATKRMCEMIVQSASTYGNVKYSSTRFGNVLGSAGSVIPLFRKQIANGGPITLTDKRIVRYFMTIPEASQLVLESGAIANNGELFVLDMGQPIRILDLAESMIVLSGVKGIEIVEVGLRPGEKLYEELLIKKEDLGKTENSHIFIERDIPLSRAEIDERLSLLKAACETGDDDAVRRALKVAVPTYRSPEEINKNAESSAEMQLQR